MAAIKKALVVDSPYYQSRAAPYRELLMELEHDCLENFIQEGR